MTTILEARNWAAFRIEQLRSDSHWARTPEIRQSADKEIEVLETLVEASRREPEKAPEDLYAWSMQGQSWSDDPYYVASSAPMRPVTVVAATKKDAIAKASTILGSAGDHRHWKFFRINAKDLRLMTDAEKEKL